MISYLAYRAPIDKVRLKMKKDMSSYFKYVGASPGLMNTEERELLMKNPEPFTVGWLYNHKDFRVITHDSSCLTVPGSTFFECCKREYTNDCLVHALNYALGHPWFTRREQIVRQIFKRKGCTFQEAIEQKVFGGISGKQLTNFALVDD